VRCAPPHHSGSRAAAAAAARLVVGRDLADQIPDLAGQVAQADTLDVHYAQRGVNLSGLIF
jgi:hypothetical protein